MKFVVAMLLATTLISCKRDTQNVYVRIENKSSENADLSIIYLSQSARIEDNYPETPIKVTIPLGEMNDIYISSTNNPVRKNDDRFLIEAWFEKQNYVDFTICVAENPYHYYVYEKNTDCEEGILSTDTPPYPNPEENPENPEEST